MLEQHELAVHVSGAIVVGLKVPGLQMMVLYSCLHAFDWSNKIFLNQISSIQFAQMIFCYYSNW